MRTVTAQEAKVYATGRINTRFRVQVLDGTGTWRDLSALAGKDWLEGVDHDEQVDQPVSQCTVRLRRESYSDSFALIQDSRLNRQTGSYALLISPGREFKVEVAILPEGIEPVSGDWREIFRGDIDEPDFATDPMSFHGRDLGGRLQDLWIEADRTYGSGGGVAVEDVIQAIIKDAHGAAWTVATAKALRDRVTPTVQNGYWYRCTTAGTTHATTQPTWPTTVGDTVADGSVVWTCYGPVPTLYVPSSPSFFVKSYAQKKESVLEAIKTLAMLMGWDVRYRWRTSSAQFELTLSEPDRAKTAEDATFGGAQYNRVQRLAINRGDIRNRVQVVYSDPADLDEAGSPKRKAELREDATSQDSYTLGLPRFFEIAEAATSQIDTSTEAGDLADAILSDLKDPTAEFSVDLPLWYAGEIWDLYAFTANTEHFSTDQKLAVVGLAHRMDAEKATTTVTLRGKPAGAHAGWLRLEARRGSAATAPFLGPSAPTGLTVTPLADGLVASFAAATSGPKAEEFELHVSSSSSFTPSSTTFRARGKLTRFEVHGLLAGSTYYVQVVPRDAKGNRGTASAEVSATTLFGDLVELALNGSFEVWSGGSGVVPDQWSVVTGSWGTNIQRTATHYDGTYGITFPSSASAYEVQGTVVPAKPSQSYELLAYAKRGTGSPANGSSLVEVYLDWMSDPTTVLSTSTFQRIEDPGPPAATAFDNFGNTVTSDAAAAYVRVRIKKMSNAVAFSAFVDALSLRAA